ncbi:MAG: glycosyltransferase family 1 protein [Chloroflexota bacterium]|nr:MAG: glycosyltransferase family 1 protein [Chloroflexota bacterium]
MHIFTALTYYRPHYSGLTIYAERLARALHERGHHVRVLTSRFKRNLAPREICNGVEVIRPSVLLRVSKGVIMPAMPFLAWRSIRQADVVHLHLPQLDAAYMAVMAWLAGKPVILTYHCDLALPRGIVHYLANLASHLANHISARFADVIVTNTRDYAEHSFFLRRYLSKVRAIFPPVEMAGVSEADVQAFRRKAKIEPGQQIIGMAARLASEKGVEYLVQAFPSVLEKYPQARVLFVGQHEQVVGEEQYAQKLAPLIRSLGEHWSFLGILSPVELSVFFQEADVIVLPSLNSTESFGMVQVEAMFCGTPVVASNLPGVRIPVTLTGMGRVIPSANAAALAEAINDVLDRPADYVKDMRVIHRQFSPETIAREYEALFDEVRKEKTRRER